MPFQYDNHKRELERQFKLGQNAGHGSGLLWGMVIGAVCVIAGALIAMAVTG